MLTREDAIKIAKGLRYDFKFESEVIVDFCNIVIEALEESLERESAFDKIIAEMEELIAWHDCPTELDNGNDVCFCEAVRQCMEIIGKYRESEVRK